LNGKGGDPEVGRKALSYARPVRIAKADPWTTLAPVIRTLKVVSQEENCHLEIILGIFF
jgi:hypothetical protein